MMMSRFFSNGTFSLVVSYLVVSAAFFSQHARCRILPISIPPNGKLNATLSEAVNAIDFRCSNDKSWRDGPDFIIQQCYAAIMVMMHQEDVDPFEPDSSPRKEFVTPHARAQRVSPDALLTPRKYVARKQIPPYHFSTSMIPRLQCFSCRELIDE